MPELTFQDVPDILKKNKEVYNEVDRYIKTYLKDYHIKGWNVIEGAKRWIAENHYLMQAPIEDPSLGGFIFFKIPKSICYLNTWHLRVYQNFVLLHEIFHIISRNQLEHSKFHIIESDLDKDADERKADYFASLLLLDADEVLSFYKRLKKEKFLDKIFLTMDHFQAPYKAVLIRLFELEVIDMNDLEKWFDQKFNFENEFKRLGIDPYPVQRSVVVNFKDIEQLIDENKDYVPDVAHESNWKTLKEVKEYFETNHNQRGHGE